MTKKSFKVLNQGRQNSCVAHAAANAIYFLDKKMPDIQKIYKTAQSYDVDEDFDDGLRRNATKKAIEQLYKKRVVYTTKLIAGLKTWLSKDYPLVLSVKSQIVDPRAVAGYHAILVYKIEGDLCYYVNSWGDTWGPYNDGTSYFKFNPKDILWGFLVK